MTETCLATTLAAGVSRFQVPWERYKVTDTAAEHAKNKNALCKLSSRSFHDPCEQIVCRALVGYAALLEDFTLREPLAPIGRLTKTSGTAPPLYKRVACTGRLIGIDWSE